MKRQGWMVKAMTRSALALLMLAVLLVSCGDEKAPDDPPLPDFGGVWRGTVLEATTGNFGETVLSVQQRDATLGGTWTAWFESGTVNGGQLSGSVEEGSDSAALHMASAAPNLCPMNLTVIISGNRASGNYASTSCPVLLTGTVEVYRDTAAGPGYNPAVPNAPEGVTVSAGDGKVSLSWSRVSGASGYHVYWSTSPGVTPVTGTRIERIASPYTHAGRTNGVTYYYVVTASNLGGESEPSAEVSAMPLPPSPGVPSTVSAVAASQQVTVSWSAASGATSYNLYWSTSPGVTKTTGAGVANVASPYTHSGLANDTSYYYVATAVNLGGESAASAQVGATPILSAPTGPTVPAESPQEDGLWRNVTYTGHTAQLDLRYDATADRWTVHGWGFCTPSYCDWGVVTGHRLVSGDVYAIWDFGWKTTEMWAHMSASQPDQLQTYMWNNYSDADGRTDFGMSETHYRDY